MQEKNNVLHHYKLGAVVGLIDKMQVFPVYPSL